MLWQNGLTTQDRGSIVGTVTAVQAVQVMGQTAHEGQLDALLHVLQPCIHTCCRHRHARKANQPAQEAIKVLQHAGQCEDKHDRATGKGQPVSVDKCCLLPAH